LSYAQHITLFKSKLKIMPSIQVSYCHKTASYSKTSGEIISSPRRRLDEFYYASTPRKADYADLGAGLIVNYKNLYAGISAFQLKRLAYYDKIPSHRLSLFISYNLFVHESVMLHGIYRLNQQDKDATHQIGISALLFQRYIINTVADLSIHHVAIGYRHNYFCLLAGYEFEIFSSHVSGHNMYYISNRTSYELSASFNLRSKGNRMSIKDIERW